MGLGARLTVLSGLLCAIRFQLVAGADQAAKEHPSGSNNEPRWTKRRKYETNASPCPARMNVEGFHAFPYEVGLSGVHKIFLRLSKLWI